MFDADAAAVLPNLFLISCSLLINWEVSFKPGPSGEINIDCHVLCTNIRGLYCNLTDLVGAATDYALLILLETMVS